MSTEKKRSKFWFTIKSVFLLLFVLFTILIIFIKSNWGQDIIVSKAVSYLSNKTDTNIEIEKLYLTFAGNILLEGLYLEDKKGDTLIYSKKLETSIALLPLIRGKEINLKKIEWEGLKANVYRKEHAENFNYNFLIESFTSQDTTVTKTNSESPKIKLGNLFFKDFDIAYNDGVQGIESHLKFNNFNIKINDLDFDKMLFKLDEIVLKKAAVKYHQTKTPPLDKKETSSQLPFVSIKNINIDKTAILYRSTPEGLKAKLYLNKLGLGLPILDLAKQKVKVSLFNLINSNIDVQQHKIVKQKTAVDPTSFKWPQWSVVAPKINIDNTTINFNTGKTIANKGVFNFEDIRLQQFNFKVSDFLYEEKNIKTLVDAISFKEQSGFQLKKVSTQLNLTDRLFNLNNFYLATNNNLVKGNVQLGFDGINTFINEPNKSTVLLELKDLKINPIDAFYFVPQLKNNTTIVAFSKKNTTGLFKLKGSLKDLNFVKTNFNWGANTRLNFKGSVKNILNNTKVALNLQKMDFTSTRQDVTSILSNKDIGVELPEKIQIKANIKGSLNKFKTDINLITTQGNITVDGRFKNTDVIAFKGAINVDDLELGKILKNEKLGVYSFTSKINGNGKNLNTLTGQLNTDFKKLGYNNYDLSDLQLSSTITKGKGNVALSFKDSNLDVELLTTLELDSVASKIYSVIDVKKVNFEKLGLTNKEIKAKFKLIANITGNNTDNLKLEGEITDAAALKDKKPYALGNIFLKGILDKNKTAFNIDSKPLKVNLIANTSPAKLITALQHQFKYYLNDEVFASKESLKDSAVTMQLNGVLKQAPVLKDLFFPALKTLDTVDIQLKFNEYLHSFTTKVSAPHIEYGQNKIDDFYFKLNAEKDSLNFNFNLDNLSTSALAIKKIKLTGEIKDQKIYSVFKAMDHEDLLIYLASEIKKDENILSFHINPSNLVLNKSKWTVPKNNKVEYLTDDLKFYDFELSNKSQKIKISSNLPGKTKNHIGFDFDHFKLATLATLFNQDKTIGAGNLNGSVIIESPFKETGIVANATVTNLEIMEVPLGKLTLDARLLDYSKYNLNLSITGNDLNIDIDGNYSIGTTNPFVDFDINLKKLNLNAIEPITSTYISETSGNLSGKVKLSGAISEPKLAGGLRFNKASLTINALNSSFVLPKEIIELDDTTISFDDFTMLDSNKNPFIINGKINTETITNPKFDLTLKAKNVEVLNSTKKDNNLFFGKVNLDTDIAVSGTLELPKIRGSLLINETSDFTYIIPESQVDIVEKKGIVLFVNKQNPDDIFTQQTEKVSPEGGVKGYDINTQLNIAEKTVFNIVVNERSGDNLKISGTGGFNFGISKNGDISLSGKYEVAEGHYDVSLYNLIKRRFDIERGSSIMWNGNPLEADMDIRAIYKLETAASGLMAQQLTGQSKATNRKYRQKLPFLVYLNLKGELLKPEISFNIDIPKDSQGELGGEVYNQVQQLNTQEGQLNKQVFSLLVLNQFFPIANNDGSSGGALSIARDNVNNVLSNQINNFSNKVLENSGLELDVGLDSYVDYQGDSPSNKTQLDVNLRKRLLNDRLIVEVGSGVNIQEGGQNAMQATPLVGTVNIQYLFDDNGRWRLKAYRKNEFESVIDGQTILTGIAVIFNQEFNKFQELFSKAVQDEVLKKNKK